MCGIALSQVHYDPATMQYKVWIHPGISCNRCNPWNPGFLHSRIADFFLEYGGKNSSTSGLPDQPRSPLIRALQGRCFGCGPLVSPRGLKPIPPSSSERALCINLYDALDWDSYHCSSWGCISVQKVRQGSQKMKGNREHLCEIS